MNAGNLATSRRLQATLNILRDGGWHTTLELHDGTGSMAVHSDVAGLRANGICVESRFAGRGAGGCKIHAYRLAEPQMRLAF